MPLISYHIPLGPVALPACQNRQFYAYGFDLANITMPKGFEDYLAPVKQLCLAAGELVGKAYLTVDEKFLRKGETQRRPLPHVDGKFLVHKNRWGGGGGWNHSCNAVPSARMPVIVASSVLGTKVFDGTFDVQPKEDGDLSHAMDILGEGVIAPPNHGYWLSPDCVHESMPMIEDTERVFIRIALPVRT